MNPLPAKITPDAIQEALFEVRFEHNEVSLVALGKLAGASLWAHLPQSSLPGAAIPEPIRELDPNLRYLPSAEFRLEPTEIIRIGSNVMSYHNTGQYLGWDRLRPRLVSTLEALFHAVSGPKITRLGFRYINVLLQREHHLDSIYDLDLKVEVGGRRPSDNLQLVYQPDLRSDDLSGIVRVFTPNFVAEGHPPGAVALIDVDIYSDAPTDMTSVEQVEAWLERAHLAEKTSFFSLLKAETVKRLQEV